MLEPLYKLESGTNFFFFNSGRTFAEKFDASWTEKWDVSVWFSWSAQEWTGISLLLLFVSFSQHQTHTNGEANTQQVNTVRQRTNHGTGEETRMEWNETPEQRLREENTTGAESKYRDGGFGTRIKKDFYPARLLCLFAFVCEIL